MRRFIALIGFHLAVILEHLRLTCDELSRRYTHTYTYDELAELLFKRKRVIVSPQTVADAAKTAYELHLISHRALNKVLAEDAYRIGLPPEL